MADLGVGIRDALRAQAAVHRPPGLAPRHRTGTRPRPRCAANIRPGVAGSRMIVCRHIPPAPGCQDGPESWPRSPGSSCQLLPAVGRPEQAGVLHPGVDRVRVIQRRLQVPDPGELPRVRRAVVPLVRAGDAVVAELVADRLPGRAAVVGALDHLPGPAAGLRRVQPVRVGGRSLDVVDLPAREVRPADVPPLPLAVRRQHERALARADQDPDTTHRCSLRAATPRLAHACPRPIAQGMALPRIRDYHDPLTI